MADWFSEPTDMWVERVGNITLYLKAANVLPPADKKFKLWKQFRGRRCIEKLVRNVTKPD